MKGTGTTMTKRTNSLFSKYASYWDGGESDTELEVEGEKDSSSFEHEHLGGVKLQTMSPNVKAGKSGESSDNNNVLGTRSRFGLK